MKVILAGEGAFGRKHLAALQRNGRVKVVALVGGQEEATKTLAEQYDIPNWSLDLDECLVSSDADAVILVTPTPIHAQQALQVLNAGKHVLVEIPMADNLCDAEALVDMAEQTGLKAMVGHVRRFNPPHVWVHDQIKRGELKIQQMHIRTRFFRRTNMNALGEPRTWTDHLLWHHAAHSIDLFMYQTGEPIEIVHAVAGPAHQEMGICMDMGIIMQTSSGIVGNLSLSFNDDGPLGTTFRYICDNGTYTAYYDDLRSGNGDVVDLSNSFPVSNGIELMQQEFFSSINEDREPNGSFHQILPTMKILDEIESSVS